MQTTWPSDTHVPGGNGSTLIQDGYGQAQGGGWDLEAWAPGSHRTLTSSVHEGTPEPARAPTPPTQVQAPGLAPAWH